MKLRDYVEQNIENIDPEFILEASMKHKERENILIIKRRNDIFRRISTTAACIAFSVVVIIAFIMMRNSITKPPADTDTVTDILTNTETDPSVTETEEDTDAVTETETESDTETEEPVDTEPLPEELPDTADFWLDRNAVANAKFSLANSWDDHTRILKAFAVALHEESDSFVTGPEAVKNLYLCDSTYSYESFGYDHHIQVQLWLLKFANGESYRYLIYEYKEILIGIEECAPDNTVYDLEYIFGYIKEDERFKNTRLSKLSEHDYDRDDEVISYNLSENPELQSIIRSYPSPLGYIHVFDFLYCENENVTGVLKITTDEKEKIYFSFVFDLSTEKVSDVTQHSNLNELYYSLGYSQEESSGSASYYESEKILFYSDENHDYYAENKITGEKYLILKGAVETENGPLVDDTEDTSKCKIILSPAVTEDLDTSGTTSDADIKNPVTDTESPDEITGTDNDDTENETDDTDKENYYYLSLSRVEVYADRYIIYEISDGYGALGVGIFDIDNGKDHYIDGMKIVSLNGDRLFIKATSSTDSLFDYLSYIPLSENEGDFYEVSTSADIDSCICYSISPDGKTLAALLQNPADNGKEFCVSMTNIDTGEVYEYFFTEMPRANILPSADKLPGFDLWSEKYFITGSEETSEFDAHIYLIPIK